MKPTPRTFYEQGFTLDHNAFKESWISGALINNTIWYIQYNVHIIATVYWYNIGGILSVELDIAGYLLRKQFKKKLMNIQKEKI
jgi:hypothetical protein